MAFSGSSYFAGIGTAFAAIAVGFAGGAMVTTSTIQPPNRLERVNSDVTVSSNSRPTLPPAASTQAASTSPEQPGAAKRAAQDPPASTGAAVPAAAPQSVSPQPEPAAPAAANIDKAETTAVQEQRGAAPAVKNLPPPSVARSEDALSAKGGRTTVGRAPDPSKDVSRSADPNKENTRKRADDRRPSDDRKFSERRRRQDQDTRRLDEATNVVRQMPRGEPVDEVVERDDVPHFRLRARHFEFGDDDGPRVINEPPPRFGFFGDN